MDCRTQLASMAIEELDKGDFVMATKILNTRIRLEPNNHEFYFERAICHYKLGNYQASLDDANEAIKLNSNDCDLHYQRGLALCGLNTDLATLNDAIISFKKAIELRAKQDDSKLSDIWSLLVSASAEVKAAKEKWKETNTKQQNPEVAQVDTPASCPSALEGTSKTTQDTANQHQSDIKVETGLKRVMVTSSSSMPATSQSSSANITKEDSYSSKYKRLRRDRERARRGTSKLCTIKPADLDELQKLSKSNSDKRYMRVIAPIDGWLYSGQLSVDCNNQQGDDEGPQYVVKLDDDPNKRSYLFTLETVLNDVIKEVRVKSVSELRKGARICCYWSRTYKCLSTGVVTSRTFEATKSLVSVKYDNGDLSALPLEDLRLLPPDYPKYMSNCDPLLLARNGDQSDPITAFDKAATTYGRTVVDGKSSNSGSHARATRNVVGQSDGNSGRQIHLDESSRGDNPTTSRAHEQTPIEAKSRRADDNSESPMDDETIPPTSETIDFITSEADPDIQEDHSHGVEHHQQSSIALEEDEVSLANQLLIDNSRASSEENNYGVEYRPWTFEGPPKRIKRNGRTYRDTYSAIRRGNEVLSVGDSAELMPRDESIMPFIAKIDGLWATVRNEMRVRVRWYYRLIETEGDNSELEDGDNALFETDHFDENDVQSIWRTTKILSWTDYCKDHIGRVNKPSDGPKIFYLAGYYDPVRRVKHLRPDVKGLQ